MRESSNGVLAVVERETWGSSKVETLKRILLAEPVSDCLAYPLVEPDGSRPFHIIRACINCTREHPTAHFVGDSSAPMHACGQLSPSEVYLVRTCSNRGLQLHLQVRLTLDKSTTYSGFDEMYLV